MPDQENETSADKTLHLARHVLAIERRLNELNEKFNNRPELQQLNSLQDTLAQIEQQLNERSDIPAAETANLPAANIDTTQPLSQAQPFEYQLVFDRSGSRAVLLEALEKTQQRLIIVCPWLNHNSVDTDLLQKFRDCLDQGCCIEIGWGYLSDRQRLGKDWRYNALEELQQLEISYPEQFKLKLLGTHEKFLVCDRSFALLGSHNLLTSSTQSIEREVGIRTTDINLIQGLIDRFDSAVEQDTQAESIDVNSISLSATELGVPEIDDEFDASPESFDIELDADENTEDLPEESQEPAVSEEFLQRLNQGERDFPGINLAGVSLAIDSYKNLNLSRANLTRAKLNKANLQSINLSGANLRKAELVKAQFSYANLTEANLEGANLVGAKLEATTLDQVNLRKANLSGANLFQVSLSGANLTSVNLCKANLRQAKIVGSDLSNSNLSQADLLGANLETANLQGVKLRQALYNIYTIFPAGFDPVKLGAYLIAPNASLSSINLASVDISGVNLTGADLQEANLNSANLSLADLSEANLSKASLVKVNFRITKLLLANLSAANLSNANLNAANLTAADLSGANLIQANLSYANLTAANLSRANLKNTNLSNAIFCGAILAEVNLVGITFQGNLSEADLSRANLCGANLTDTNMSKANLVAADLRGANLTSANLQKANLKEAKLSGANLSGAKLSGAIMPDGAIHD